VLRSYTWPGNVRELENVMKRIAALLGAERAVDADALLPFLDRREGPAPGPRRGGDDEERSAILAACREANGNKSRAAVILGVSRKTLYARLHRLGIRLS
jgi:transcriptional regulator of acetoin/glycerol metabolism